jgi:hypothetical protein
MSDFTMVWDGIGIQVLPAAEADLLIKADKAERVDALGKSGFDFRPRESFKGYVLIEEPYTDPDVPVVALPFENKRPRGRPRKVTA